MGHNRQIFREAYHPRKLPVTQQADYYQAMSKFWVSVVDKYPNAYNRQKATLFVREWDRVKLELKNK